MNDLATKWVLLTVFVFTGGALLALVWSVMSGHWSNLQEAARLPLEDGDDLDDDGRPAVTIDEPNRRAPAGS